MFYFSYDISKKGYEKGRMESLVKNLSAIMEKLNMTADEAMDLLHVAPEEREECKKRLNA